MGVSEKILNVAMVTSVICAVVVTGMLIDQRLERQEQNEELRPRIVPNWAELQEGPLVSGSRDARVRLVEFSDYQCPYCAKFALEVLPQLKERFGSELLVVHRQWPLSNHPHAYTAARAALCAAKQDRFEQFHSVLFGRQTEIGATALVDFAQDAGVSDLVEFEACAADSAPVASIENDIRLAKKIGALGTPTILVDG